MPRLIDYKPLFISYAGRYGLGLLMDAPNQLSPPSADGRPWRLFVLFANPLDGGQPWAGGSRSLILLLFPTEEDRLGIIGCGDFKWTRTGESFDDLSLSPSIDAHSAGHFTITKGGW